MGWSFPWASSNDSDFNSLRGTAAAAQFGQEEPY